MVQLGTRAMHLTGDPVRVERLIGTIPSRRLAAACLQVVHLPPNIPAGLIAKLVGFYATGPAVGTIVLHLFFMIVRQAGFPGP